MEFNREAAAVRMRDLSQYMGVDDLAARVRSLNSICGIQPRLREYGVTEESLPGLADKAVQDGCHQLNPRPCTRQDLLDLYRQAW